MTPGLDLSITICSWNTLEDTRACLASLNVLREECAFEVVLIDNGSSDGSPEMVRSEFPWVNLIVSEANLGFTGGQNACLKARKAPDALLLNSDTIVHAGALSGLIAYRKAHPEVGILGPKLLNPDGSLQFSCRRFPNPVAALFRNTFVGRLFPKNRWTREYLMADFAHDQASDVDWLSGAALYATEEVIEKVGVLDERFFMYCEDVDLCFRAHRAGFKVVYLPTTVITHAIGTSSSRAANRMIVRFHRSMLMFYRKNMVPDLPMPARPFAIAFAASALAFRASLFLAKNGVDAMLRSVGLRRK
jgi:hypothetical protein